MTRATQEIDQQPLAVYNSRNPEMLPSSRLRWLCCALLLAAQIALASDRAANCPALNWPRDSEMTTGFCLDASHGWKAIYDHVQNRTSIASTSDGGNDWTIQQLAPIGYSATAMFFLDQHDGWVGLYNPTRIKSSVAATVDGGEHWTIEQVDGLGYSPSSLFFLDTKHGWLELFMTGSTHMDLQCKIVRTDNGGARWTEIREQISRRAATCDSFLFKPDGLSGTMGKAIAIKCGLRMTGEGLGSRTHFLCRETATTARFVFMRHPNSRIPGTEHLWLRCKRAALRPST